jgi:hypothetical protein
MSTAVPSTKVAGSSAEKVFNRLFRESVDLFEIPSMSENGERESRFSVILPP